VRPLFLLLFSLSAAAAWSTELEQSVQQSDMDVAVSLDAAEQSGSAEATVVIHARREVIWKLITSCPDALTLVPGLTNCEVLEVAPDQSWANIHHVMKYSWYVPTVSYQLRCAYHPPSSISFERTAGDLRTLRGSWELTSQGAVTVARYRVELAPGFWVPRWLVRGVLKRDLPTMLRALRTRAEGVEARGP
jgi:Polyketide cyclase / dehydrase and lipid transport